MRMLSDICIIFELLDCNLNFIDDIFTIVIIHRWLINLIGCGVFLLLLLHLLNLIYIIFVSFSFYFVSLFEEITWLDFQSYVKNYNLSFSTKD